MRRSGGSQSTSKNCAYALDGPFSSTSHHHGFSRSIAMWFGTMSSSWPIAAQLPADLRVIDYVVAVSAAPRGLQTGRAIEMVDTQFFQVRDDLRRIVEAEVAVQLDAVSG